MSDLVAVLERIAGKLTYNTEEEKAEFFANIAALDSGAADTADFREVPAADVSADEARAAVIAEIDGKLATLSDDELGHVHDLLFGVEPTPAGNAGNGS